MRKLYIVLLSGFIIATILAYYQTFGHERYMYKGSYEHVVVPEETDGVGMEVSPSPIVTPTQIQHNEQSSHLVGGEKFVLLETYGSGPPTTTLVKSEGGEYVPLDPKYKWVEKYINTETTDFWFMEEEKKLYLLRYKEEEYRSDSPEFSELVMVDYSNSNDVRDIVVSTFKNGIYESKKFAGYNSKENAFVLVTEGGDGCGGWGDVSTFNLETKRTNLITKIGMGCSDEERYFTFYKDRLILGETVECDIKDYGSEGRCIASIYSLDPFNLDNRNSVYGFTSPYVYDLGYLNRLNKRELADNEVVLFKRVKPYRDSRGYNSDTETYIFDLEKGVHRMVTY